MSSPVTFAPVDASTWPDLERFFEQRGGPHYCWCMLWRPMPSKERKDKAAKKRALKAGVTGGVPVGLLAYQRGQPVAWCSIAPKRTFRPPDKKTATSDAVWFITCFFVARSARGQGLMAQLIEAALDYAKSCGANVLEAYPVEKDSPTYRFMGFVEQFERAGFRLVGSAGTRRHVMQRRLDR